MKKLILLVLTLFCMIGLISCKRMNINDIKNSDSNPKDDMYIGLNAEVVNVDVENQIIYVKDCDDAMFFEKKSAINGEKLRENKQLFYVDYDTGELSYIDITDLSVGDHVIINVSESELEVGTKGLIEVEQIQLCPRKQS